MTRRVWIGIAAALPPLCAESGDAASIAAEKWLALIDRGKYKDAWKKTCRHYRPQITSGDWEGQVRAIREAAGPLRDRKNTSARNSRTLPGAPDGDYTILEYSTAFEKKPKAVEIVVLSREGGAFKAAGYSIR